MKKVIIDNSLSEDILLKDIPEDTTIFIKKNGKLKGMIVYKIVGGWIAQAGPFIGVLGYHNNREQCIKQAQHYGYEFYIE